MRISPDFPDDRRPDPMGRAELRVYRQLAESDLAGRALYQVRAGSRTRELDFLVFLEGLAGIGIEVKGGTYRIRGGEWQLRTPDGWQWKPSPVAQVCEAADALAGAIGRCVARECPVMPVLIFADTRPDRDMDVLANASGVKVLWGRGRFADRLVDLAVSSTQADPPTSEGIGMEVEAIMAGE